MLPWILVGIVVVVAGVVLLVATRPAEFSVTRSATMSAPAATVHALVNDFHEWSKWSPWEHRDPNMTRTYDGTDAGKGAEYRWSGDKNVGEGMMRITESVPPELILIHLEFIKPFKATNTTECKFTPEDGGTKVTWSMMGRNNFMAKAMSLFMDMDKMIGKDFEQGLADMKAAAEKSAA